MSDTVTETTIPPLEVKAEESENGKPKEESVSEKKTPEETEADVTCNNDDNGKSTEEVELENNKETVLRSESTLKATALESATANMESQGAQETSTIKASSVVELKLLCCFPYNS